MPAKRGKKTAPKKTVTATSLDSKIYAACDIMRRSNCSGAMNYIPELSWILFLRILDDLEQQQEARSATLGVAFTPSLGSPFRWRDWAPKPPDEDSNGDGPGWKRRELTEGVVNQFKQWVNDQLIPHIKELKNQSGVIARQKVGSKAGDGGQFFTTARNHPCCGEDHRSADLRHGLRFVLRHRRLPSPRPTTCAARTEERSSRPVI